ncbi:MAG TPA: twin-arginine translocation signal domain-containing protein, partial [Pirellulales bacterium]
MSESTTGHSSRREFLQNTGRIAAAGALASMVVPKVHAAEDNTIRIALVGCGGRGGGAANDALSVDNGPLKLVAMADVFPEKLSGAFNGLQERHSDRMDVPED